MANAIYSPFSGYILWDAVWSGTAPLTGYRLSDFAFFRPDMRVVYGATSISLVATLAGGARLADIFALPISNIDTGATKLTLTNGAGFSTAITIPAVPTGPYGRLPFTAVKDLRTVAGTRTSNVWTLTVTSNSVNVKLGAAIWLGTAIDFTKNYRPGLIQSSEFFNSNETNFYGVENTIRARTRRRFCDLGVPSRDAQRDQFMDWADSGEGAGLPSVFWPNPSVNDALLGKWPNAFANTWVVPNKSVGSRDGFSPMEFRFTELNKGIPLL